MRVTLKNLKFYMGLRNNQASSILNILSMHPDDTNARHYREWADSLPYAPTFGEVRLKLISGIIGDNKIEALSNTNTGTEFIQYIDRGDINEYTVVLDLGTMSFSINLQSRVTDDNAKG